MLEKIGEMLVKEGLINQSELEEALKSQVIYGGKLGTNLIEMGFISEEEFGSILSRVLKVPYYSANELRDIPQAVIDSLPSELAEKYKVVPLRLENRRLTLVMADPSDLRILDEISFRTGMLIRPVISSELGLVHALEKYYNIAREIRYISLNRNVPAVKKRIPAATPTQVPANAAAAQPAPQTAAAFQSVTPAAQAVSPANPAPPAPLAEKKPAPILPPLAISPIPTATRPATPPPPPEPVRETAVLTVATVDIAPTPPPTDIFAEFSTPTEEVIPVTLEMVAQRLIMAEDREDIADAVIGWMGEQFHSSALFLVRGEVASGWHAVSEGNLVGDFDRLRIPLAEPSALKTVADSRSPVLGPLQRTPYNSMLLQELGGTIPKTSLLLPLLMLGRITAILYIDGPDTLLQEKMPEVQKLSAKMIMAFEILMLKNKILSL